MFVGGLVSLEDFLRLCWFTFSRRLPFFALMNLLYFGSILTSAFFTQLSFPPSYWEPIQTPEILPVEGNAFFVLVLNIFLFNFFVSAFILITLTGIVFFLFPAGFLVLRAWYWGSVLSQLPTFPFLAVLPTLILEGEGYVLAGVAGVSLGLSWLSPERAYKGECLSRLESFKRALKDFMRIYVLVALFLFVAALVEAFTIVSISR